MDEHWLLIAALAAGTLSIRLAGAWAGQAIPAHGPLARALDALPGCLIVALVATSMLTGGWREWAAGAIAAAAAVATRSVPATMAVGIAAIWALRHMV
ncbi:putative membrane protein [Roseiarcus fermentans]|uniref:Putative membrane protein n=1 Tax=Roseiarcus fermentans TaxID=1473586 RepID=A0A366FL02_9HYPH|nr:AzlD domain-containing protein [Roseiarcus fermentans]RBP14405.1 putative membrane protein [Roseiarcus fermentans]